MPSKLTVRCTEEEYHKIEQKTKEANIKSLSEYVRFVALNAEITVTVKEGGK